MTSVADSKTIYSATEWQARMKARDEAKSRLYHRKLLEHAGLDGDDADRLPDYGAADSFGIPSMSQYTYKDILKQHPWDEERWEWLKAKPDKPKRVHVAADRFAPKTLDEQLEATFKKKQLPEGCTPRDEVVCLIRDIPVQKVTTSMAKADIGLQPHPGLVPGSAPPDSRPSNSKDAEEYFSYVGEWRLGKMAGKGTYTFADGHKYTGAFLNNRPHGYGEAEYKTGTTYRGEWKDGQYDGLGELEYPYGIKYKGMFAKGYREGHGRLTYPLGAYYEGEWKMGLQHGRGEMANKHGHKYVGSWANGLVHGSGSFYHPGGERIVRFWPPRTFTETLYSVRDEQEEEEEEKQRALEELLGPLRQRQLEEYVQQVRDDILAEEERQRQEEEEERRRILIERREAEKKKRMDMLEASIAAREAAEKGEG